jgi:hypothetical protein
MDGGKLDLMQEGWCSTPEPSPWTMMTNLLANFFSMIRWPGKCCRKGDGAGGVQPEQMCTALSSTSAEDETHLNFNMQEAKASKLT